MFKSFPIHQFLQIIEVGIIVFAFMIFCVALLFFLEPTSPVQNIFLTNTTDNQTSITWTTQIPTKATVVISSTGSFPILPFLAKQNFKDDGEKNTARVRSYTTHHVTVTDLKPETKYAYRIYQGVKSVRSGSFTTPPLLPSLRNPNPVYGRALSSDKKTPIIGAIVYLRLQKDKDQSAILSTLTNSEGGWSIDLANARSSKMDSFFTLQAPLSENVIIEAGRHGRFKASTTVGKDKPWPDIIFK